MIIDKLLKFLSWSNLGLYHKVNPLTKLDIQNDSPHYRVNEIDTESLYDLINKFNKENAKSK
jgi:hypothetical protein